MASVSRFGVSPRQDASDPDPTHATSRLTPFLLPPVPHSHPGYFGKVGMRYFHKTTQKYFCPTINLDNPAVETPIDLAPNAKREREIKIALSNSFGFGGTNASVLFGKVD